MAPTTRSSSPIRSRRSRRKWTQPRSTTSSSTIRARCTRTPTRTRPRRARSTTFRSLTTRKSTSRRKARPRNSSLVRSRRSSSAQPRDGERIEAFPFAVAHFTFGFFQYDRLVLAQDLYDLFVAHVRWGRNGDDDAGRPTIRPWGIMLFGPVLEAGVGSGERAGKRTDAGSGGCTERATHCRADTGADARSCGSALPDTARLRIGMLVAADRKGAVLTGGIVVKTREAVVRNAGCQQRAHCSARAVRGVVGTCKDSGHSGYD